MKVSIITVCYNSDSTIEDTIRSVIHQSYKDIEYIVVDGKSSDRTVEIIEKFSSDIEHVISERDNGMYDAINKGIELSSGDIIGILNADDFYTDSQVISDVVNLFLNSDCDGIYADLYYVDDKDTDRLKRYWKSGNYKHGKFLKGWMPPHPTFFLKKSCYQKYGKYNLLFKSAADYELMLRMIHKYCIRLSYLKRVIVKMRVGGMSNSSLLNRLRANREDKRAWEINDLQPKPYTFIFKPLRKLKQFISAGEKE